MMTGHTSLAVPTGDAQQAMQDNLCILHTSIDMYCETVKQKLDEMLEAGLISKSRSRWSALMVLVKRRMALLDYVLTIEY